MMHIVYLVEVSSDDPVAGVTHGVRQAEHAAHVHEAPGHQLLVLLRYRQLGTISLLWVFGTEGNSSFHGCRKRC
jgi:hypothetical protein